MKNQKSVTAKTVNLSVINFNKEVGYLNEQKASVYFQKGKGASMQYEIIQSLKLSKKSQALLIAFVESL